MSEIEALPCGSTEEIEKLITEGCFGIDEPQQNGEVCKSCPVAKISQSSTHADKFRIHMMSQHNKSLDEIDAFWFKDADGYCVPSDYLSDELLKDIMNKFYYPLDYLRALTQEKRPELKKAFIKIVVMPDYEDYTYAVMYLEDKVLVEEYNKAWNYFWEEEEKFNEWVEASLKQIEERLP